ncbi:MAG TPA: TolC family protein [Bryobacteraceae bacterium]|nr:TolC family protein [Bryobacteraceae bacterium]
METIWPWAAAMACFLVNHPALAQPVPGQAITLERAVSIALDYYPSVRVSEAESRDAAAAIKLARTAYLPSLDAVAGINRATRNNVFGLLFPSQIIAPISGPVLNTNSLGSAWGSTVGLTVAWEPFDFGLRRANVAIGEAGRARAEATIQRTRLEVATLVADNVLTLIAAQQTVIAAQAAVERSSELLRITEALVKADLRPGVESSLARADQASARAQLFQARQAVREAKASLAAYLGLDANTLNVAVGKLLATPSEPSQDTALAENPAARVQNAAAVESEARLRAVDRSYFPRFTLEGTTYARGTGALNDGRLLGGVNGLGPNVHNWGVGFTATFPIFDLPTIRARRESATARLEVERSRYDQVLVELKRHRDRAAAAYQGALEVAETTPVAVEAAGAAVQQARARYQSGLSTAIEVADAQRRLAQAEIDDSLAKLNIWRARLAVAAAMGEITSVLAEASQ